MNEIGASDERNQIMIECYQMLENELPQMGKSFLKEYVSGTFFEHSNAELKNYAQNLLKITKREESGDNGLDK